MDGKFYTTSTTQKAHIVSLKEAIQYIPNSKRNDKQISVYKPCYIDTKNSDDEFETSEPVSAPVHKPASQVSFTSKLIQDENDDDELDNSSVHSTSAPIETKPTVNDTVGPKKVIKKTVTALKK